MWSDTLLETAVDALNIIKQFVSTLTAGRTRNEVRRQFFPRLFELFKVGLHLRTYLYLRQFIRLCEDNRKGYAIFAEEVEEIEVFLLRLVAYVNEDEKAGELFAFQYIMTDKVPEFIHLTLTPLGISVAREVDQVPRSVDEKVVDEQCLARCGRCQGQFLTLRQHVDERGLADIRATDEGIFGQCGLRTHVGTWTAGLKFCGFNCHEKVNVENCSAKLGVFC